MNSGSQKNVTPEQLLEQLDQDQKQFQNHWVWKELSCTPQEFFQAVEKHVEGMNVSPQKWQATYEKVRSANYVRAMEMRQAAKPINFKMLGAIRV